MGPDESIILSKTAEIKKARRTLGRKATTAEIVAHLAGRGVHVTSAYVSSVRWNLRRQAKLKRQDRERRNGQDRNGGMGTGGDEVNIEHLVLAKQLVNKLGGIDEACRAVAALAKLKGAA